MTSALKLKDEARRFEQQEDWDQAIQIYLRVLRAAEEAGSDIELPLYNRVGDLYLKLGRAPDAVRYYERAADRYAEAGFYNNALALSSKALRHAPARLELMRKLGRFSALQGFATDAHHWFHTYAEQMSAQGASDEARAALEELAELSAGADVTTGSQLPGFEPTIAPADDGDVLPANIERVADAEDEADGRHGLVPPAAEATIEEDAAFADRSRRGEQLGDRAVEWPTAANGEAAVEGDSNRFPDFPRWDEQLEPAASAPREELHRGAGPARAVGPRGESKHPLTLALSPGGGEGNGGPPAPDVEARARVAAAPAEPPSDGYVDLSSLVESDPARSAETHYDLGIAYKEMGLIDEAISEFQLSLRTGGGKRLEVLEELGQCFLASGQHRVAVKVLEAAAATRCDDHLELIGVFYYLGRAYEAVGRSDEARDAYERVIGLDMEFKDVMERLARL